MEINEVKHSEMISRANARQLRILDRNKPLSAVQCAYLIRDITDDDISTLAIGQPTTVKGRCMYERNYVGQGTCLAKKYNKYSVSPDPRCNACKTDEIVIQLNYIFKHKYKGRYKAEWVDTKRKCKK
jgi:hypothetical protein